MDKWLRLIWRLENIVGHVANILWSKEINYIRENMRKWFRMEKENRNKI
jgi:hypothetical protein